ncbi:codanin-1-like isoform X2 [Actinia tenebrosa]|nr:codanin-1-like isoform X2 [Actinia tenebrosa]
MDNLLYSIHNAVYFAIVILENLKRLICLLDKGTLRQLALNPRIAEFSPTFKEWLDQKYEEHSTPKVLDLSFTSPIGGVPFSADRDNKNNFPSDKAFQNFRKQRDLFYELVREWEDCHNKPGWIMEENMGNNIRSLVHQRPDLANHAPFARLFQSQLLQMCKGENLSSDPNSSLARLRNANPDKFQRLQDRFVTPLSLTGPCPPPSFSEIQEFFKGFITCAESHSFSRHLMDNLIMKITELNDTVFPFGEAKDQERNEKNPQTKEIQQSFNVCLSNLRILAKFLGYLVFDPYQSGTNQSKQEAEPVIRMRNKVPQPFDVLCYLKTALEKGNLVLTVPWVVEYLSMMDPVAPYLDYYHKVLILLVHIYSSQSSKDFVTYGRLLIVTCLGWLFENPVLPESLFFKSFEERNASEEILQNRPSLCLDSCDVIDQEMLYTWCPYLGEVKNVLSEASTGMSSRAGPVKKITLVCTEQPTQMSSNNRQLLQQLEENFYRIQPDFLKRTSEFLIERLCSNILSGIKTSIVPGALKKGAEQMEAYLASIGFPDDENSDQAKEKSRPQVLHLIHSVTSDAVKKALDITANSSDTSLKAFQILCPEDTNPKVISTAAQLTARHVKQKSSDWIHLSLPSMVEKDLFNHFDKFTNALLHAKAKKARLRQAVDHVVDHVDDHVDDHANTNTKDTVTEDKRDGVTEQTTPEEVLRKHVQSLKVLLVNQTRQLTQASSADDIQDIASILTSVYDDLTLNKTSVEGQDICFIDVGNVSLELAFILACRCSCGIEFLSSENNITRTLLKIWRFLKDNGHPAPLHQLLSSPRLRLLSTLENRQITWSVLANLCASFIHYGLVTTHNVEQWFLKLLDATNDQIIVKGCCMLLQSYRSQDTNQTSTGVEFSLLMATLFHKFSQDPDVLTSIRRCITDCGSSITLPSI